MIPYFSEHGLTLKQVKPKHILEYYNHKNTGGRLDGKEGGFGIASLRSHAALIKAIFNEAVVLEYIQGNPALNVTVPKRATTSLGKDKNVYMTAGEANQMLADIRTEEIYPLVYVALYYGLRKSEVLGLKWDAVDFEDLESVKSWLRHADIETTSNIYLHISNGRKRLMAKDMTGTFIEPYSAKDNSDAENQESAG